MGKVEVLPRNEVLAARDDCRRRFVVALGGAREGHLASVCEVRHCVLLIGRSPVE